MSNDHVVNILIMKLCLQDCIVGATYKKSGKREKDGQEFYDYELSSNVRCDNEPSPV